jgi:flagellar basal-body rod protein FlgG
MNNSMISAAVSMNSMQSRLDLIADNIANMDTNGYKRKENSFEDVLTRVQEHSKDFRSSVRATPLGYNLGYGVKLASVSTNMEQGTLQNTGVPTDLAIEGNGLFAVESNGTIAYTREGAFHFVPDPTDNTSMLLVNNVGDKVLDDKDNQIKVPAVGKVAIDAEGRVWSSNGIEPRVQRGQIQIVEPIRPEGLVQMDGNKFVLANGVTNNDVFGTKKALLSEDLVSIRSGYQEKSNVDLTVEMTDMVQVQRAYQLMARSLTSSDTMMGLANNLRG